jgi:hypothetical protein
MRTGDPATAMLIIRTDDAPIAVIHSRAGAAAGSTRAELAAIAGLPAGVATGASVVSADAGTVLATSLSVRQPIAINAGTTGSARLRKESTPASLERSPARSRSSYSTEPDGASLCAHAAFLRLGECTVVHILEHVEDSTLHRRRRCSSSAAQDGPSSLSQAALHDSRVSVRSFMNESGLLDPELSDRPRVPMLQAWTALSAWSVLYQNSPATPPPTTSKKTTARPPMIFPAAPLLGWGADCCG